MELGFCHQLIPQSWDLLSVFEEKKEAEGEEVPVPGEIEKNSILNTKF